MLNKKIEYWVISTAAGYGSLIEEYFDTFEDAKANVMKYADEWCHKGDCSVEHYETIDGGIRRTDTIHFENGVEVTYPWENRIKTK